MIDLADMLELLDTDELINVLNRTGDVYHVLISGLKDEIRNTSVFEDIETYEVYSVYVDAGNVNIVLSIEEDYFTMDDDNKSGYVDFYKIMNDVADEEMFNTYDELGFYVL